MIRAARRLALPFAVALPLFAAGPETTAPQRAAPARGSAPAQRSEPAHPVPAQGAERAQERRGSESERSQRETFLRTADVVGAETFNVGITLPERLELEQDGIRRRAMFKFVEITYPEQVRVGAEVQEGMRDSWRFELAAYELDKLLGLDLVPVTVVRSIGNRDGAVIDWIEDVLPDYGASPEAFDLEAWDDLVAEIWLFDYLAYNIDRTPGNLLVTGGFGVKLIDHSRAFQRFLIPMRPLSRFPRSAIDRLRRVSDGELRITFGPWLSAEEVDALLERRRRVLARVDGLLASKPETEVLF